MANIRKIEGKTGVSYKITVTTGRDAKGKQIRHYKTWVPDKSMTARQMEKEAQRIAFEFEKEIELGFQADNRQTFEKYSRYVLAVKEQEGVARGTLRLYERTLETRVFPVIGHMKLRDIRPQHLTNLYKSMRAPGQKKKAMYATPKPAFYTLLKEMPITQKELARRCGLNEDTIGKMKRPGKHTRVDVAEKVAAYFQKPTKSLFDVVGEDATLSNRYIQDVHRCISTVFTQAEKEMLIQFNPAARATVPGADRHTPNYFQPEQIEQILKALESEEIKWRTMIHLFVVTGCRRGEILGLKWSKVDFTNNQIYIDCSLKTDEKTHEVYEGPTKTRNTRYVNFPDETAALLKKYRVWLLEQRFKCGSLWENTDYVFPNKTGGAMRPDNVTIWLSRFSKRHGLPHINPHAFRHSAASIMIANGVDVVTVSKMLGHSKASTTMDVYSHAIEESKRKATECIADVILRKKSG